MTAPDPPPTVPTSNVSLTPPAQTVTFEAHAVGVGMTEDHYEWVKTRMRGEIKGSHTSSIWLALALAALGIVATLGAWVAIGSRGR